MLCTAAQHQSAVGDVEGRGDGFGYNEEEGAVYLLFGTWAPLVGVSALDNYEYNWSLTQFTYPTLVPTMVHQ